MTSTDDADPLAYAFDADHGPHAAELTSVLGGKGAGLALMTAMGLPVPPGFVLTTAACRSYLAHGWSDDHERAVLTGLAELEARTGRRLGDPDAPLLVSVRGGARVSMPGMLATVLDVGMTDDVARALAHRSGDADFAADTHRRAVRSFAVAGADLPSSPVEQVHAAVRAVFDSWWSDRAVRYRSVEGVDDGSGTAATVQVMVFGNLGDDSGAGVAFSRDPTSGRPGLMGDFLPGAQGEDVVAGDHETLPLAEMRTRWPARWDELAAIADRLEHEFADMVDIEFTVERGRLWLLQVRRAKRSRLAALRAAVDMAEDPAFPVDRSEAVRRCRASLDDPPTVDSTADTATEVVIVEGQAAAPGRAVGVLCLTIDRAVALEAEGTDVVLVRRETAPADVLGMAASVGLVTTVGGPLSHAAVVARAWGLPAVVGASALSILDAAVEAGGVRVEEGQTVTVDGDAGRLLWGAHPGRRTVAPEADVIRRWAAEMDGGAGGRP